jgi:hypothetical protein
VNPAAAKPAKARRKPGIIKRLLGVGPDEEKE